jgi:prepilin-type N-terminal cleavage/methylation domain-containing protein
LTPRRGAEPGFTVIELMVVVLLLGAVVTYGFLQIDNMVPTARLDKAARELGQMLTRLRSLSVFSGRDHYLEYNLDAQTYRISRPSTLREQEEGADDYIYSEWFELPKKVRIKAIQFSDRDADARGLVRVGFTPTGECAGHLIHILSDEILDEERNRYTVELNPITGLVTYTQGVHKNYDQVRSEFEFR